MRMKKNQKSYANIQSMNNVDYKIQKLRTCCDQENMIKLPKLKNDEHYMNKMQIQNIVTMVMMMNDEHEK